MKTTGTKEIVKNKKTQIELWKEEHKKIFKSIIGDIDFIWRRITRKEYAEVMALRTSEDLEERIIARQKAIVKMMTLNIEESVLDEYLEELPGLASVLSEEVLDKSGFYITQTVEL